MSDEYRVASNKIKVGRVMNGGVYVANPDVMGKTSLSVRETDALREFFQAEADEKWGRWRSKIYPDWTTVSQRDVVTVHFRHEDGRREFFVSRDTVETLSVEARVVAHEYFEAHPEPKPWHDAKEDEVWAVVTPEWGEKALIVTEFSEGLCFSDVDANHAVGVTSPSITVARRIWPEVDAE